jgi:replicative DNA helicase
MELNNQNRKKTRRPANTGTDLRPHFHYDLDMEAAVLGACLLEREAFGRLVGLLEPDHFYGIKNQTVMQVMFEMWNDGLMIDLLTVAVEIHRKALDADFDMNIPFYLSKLSREVVNSTHLEQHALYIRQMYAERECLRIQMEAGSSSEDTLQKMMGIQDQISKILSVKGTDDWHDMATVMVGLGKHQDEVRGRDLLGVPTGFKSLDTLIAGWQGGQLIVVGARPSVGKSSFVSGVSIHAAENGYKVGIINLEMPEKQLGGRLASFYSGIDFWRIYRAKLKDDEQERQMYSAMSDMANLPIWISDKTNVSGADIRAKAIKLKKRAGMDLLIIDYLQLIEAEGRPGETREREVARLSRALKLLAMDLNVPVMILAQLNRDSEKSADRKPRMSNIRESGAIEQDADVVLLLHRDWKAGVLQDEKGNSTEGQANIIIEKNRNGACTDLPVSFDPKTMKFYEENSNSTPISNQFPTGKNVF